MVRGDIILKKLHISFLSVFLAVFLTGCLGQQPQISIPKLLQYNNEGKIQVSVLPKEYKENLLTFELNFTTHSGDLTGLDWKKLIKVSSDENLLEINDIVYLRKSEHHPIMEIKVEVTREHLVNSKKIIFTIDAINGEKAKTYNWNTKDLQVLITPEIGVLSIDEKGILWLLTSKEKRQINKNNITGKLIRLENNSWLILDKDKGKMSKLVINSNLAPNKEMIKSVDYKDAAYFRTEKILFAIDNQGDNLLAVNLENGETIFSYKDIIKNGTALEIIGNKLLVAEKNKIVVVNLESFMLEKKLPLREGNIKKLLKTQDNSYLLAITENNQLIIIDVKELTIFKKLYYIKDFSYDFLNHKLFTLNTGGKKLVIYDLNADRQEERELGEQLRNIVVIPNTDFLYGVTRDNTLIFMNYKTGEIKETKEEIRIKNLEDYYVFLQS
ncbi:MAG: hypothetical protein PWQ67_824 [Clostridia bacterium]|nr:hypothetical protein [Clostridia bacterium]MDN5322370.1 hypothetical protein [Clostridia bacterium]